MQEVAGLGIRDEGRPGAARDGLRLAGAVGARGFWRRERRARQRESDDRRRRAATRPRPKVFAAGDMRRGQSLVVWAIREGRQCARGRRVPDGVFGIAAITCPGATRTKGPPPITAIPHVGGSKP